VDLHTSYKVWSAVLVTRWSSHPQISCRACGVKAKLEGLLFSAFLGWWGIPWGPLLTPIQLGRNLVGLSRRALSAPSAGLVAAVRANLASQIVTRSHQSE